MRCSKAKSRAKRATDAVKHLTSRQNDQDICELFHNSSQIHSLHAETIDVGGGVVPVAWDSGQAQKHAFDRIAVGHVLAQARGLKQFLNVKEESVGFVTSSCVFDDANIWISLPPGSTAAEELASSAPSARAASAHLKRKVKGRMRFIPVLSVVEKLHKLEIDSDSHSLSLAVGASVFSPVQVLPKANYKTVEDRLHRWTILNGTGRTGCCVDLYGEIDLQSLGAWTNISVVKDCLAVNGNIIHTMEQSALAVWEAASTDRQRRMVTTIYHVNCCAHMTVLACKPLMKFQEGLSTNTVRMGHLCQSSRVSSRLSAALDFESKRFVYRRVAEPPMGYQQWMVENRKKLEFTRVALDLSTEQFEDILYYDNSCFNDPLQIHYCLPGCRCGRTREGALMKIQVIAVSLTPPQFRLNPFLHTTW